MITKEKFEDYVSVQKSGITNMFNVSVVMECSGLSKDECLDIMRNYTKYSDMYL